MRTVDERFNCKASLKEVEKVESYCKEIKRKFDMEFQAMQTFLKD